MQWIKKKRLCTRLAVGTHSSSITAEHLTNVTPLTRRLNEDIAQRKHFFVALIFFFSPTEIFEQLWYVCGEVLMQRTEYPTRAGRRVCFHCVSVIVGDLRIICPKKKLSTQSKTTLTLYVHSENYCLQLLTVNGNNIMPVIIPCSKSNTKWAALPLNAVGGSVNSASSLIQTL